MDAVQEPQPPDLAEDPAQVGGERDLARFKYLLDFASFDKLEHSYRLPTSLYDEDSADW